MVRQDHEPPPLPSYALDVVGRAIITSGHSLVVSECDAPEFDSELRLAGPGRQVHELVVSREYREHSLHFMVNAAYKILRFWSVPPEDRYLPVSRMDVGLPKEAEEELRSKLADLPEPLLENMSRFLYQGLIRQLTSFPVDLSIEQAIAEGLPEHKNQQEAYLRRQVKDFEPTLLPEMSEAFPEKVSAASNAMNVAFSLEAAALTGGHPSEGCLQSPYRDLAERLRSHLSAIRPRDYEGDRMVTDVWASELGLRDWYGWKRLDEVR